MHHFDLTHSEVDVGNGQSLSDEVSFSIKVLINNFDVIFESCINLVVLNGGASHVSEGLPSQSFDEGHGFTS